MDSDTARKLRQLEQWIARLETKPGPLWQRGTYTPTYDGVTPGTTTYTTQAGFWRRVGDVVFFNGRVAWSAATGTGAAVISLPFASQNTTNMRYAPAVYVTSVTFANGAVQAAIVPNSAVFSMSSALTNAAPTAVNVEAAGTIDFSGWFVL